MSETGSDGRDSDTLSVRFSSRLSLLHSHTVAFAVDRIMKDDIPPGIYNLYSGVVHLPTFIEKRFPNWRGEVLPHFQSAFHRGFHCYA